MLPTHYPNGLQSPGCSSKSSPSCFALTKGFIVSRSRGATLVSLLFGTIFLWYVWHTDRAPWDGHPFGFPNSWPRFGNSKDSDKWAKRAQAVKDAFVHAYTGYEKHAYPNDELLPVSGGMQNNFNGWGVSLVDSIDTLIFMDLQPQLSRAIKHVASLNFSYTAKGGGYSAEIPFFETVIRYLGGLLSAYALTNNTIFLTKADDLANRLLPAFNTSSGIAAWGVEFGSGAPLREGSTIIAEFGSCQLEYKYLAKLTGRAEYFDAVDRAIDLMEAAQDRMDAMWSVNWDNVSGMMADPSSGKFSVGAEADSAYEYLLKGYLLSGRSETRLLDMYTRSMRFALTNLTYVSNTRELLYITDDAWGSATHKLEHLTCFFPGLLALGAATVSDTEVYNRVAPMKTKGTDRELWTWAAEGIAHTCWLMYKDQPSGVGPEIVVFNTTANDGNASENVSPQDQPSFKRRWGEVLDTWRKAGPKRAPKPPGVNVLSKPVVKYPGALEMTNESRDYDVTDRRNLLRPETIESVYVMWRTTKDPIWRERGWEMFKSVERAAQTEYGYGSVWGVDSEMPTPSDDQPSFFLAETLKYYYLLFLDYDPVPMDKWVFNTEAHPLPIFEWTAKEKQRYRIH